MNKEVFLKIGKRILGLDPGVTTGWVVADVRGGNLIAVNYGIVPVFAGGASAFRAAMCNWLEWAAKEFDLRTSRADIVFEAATSSFPQIEASATMESIVKWCSLNKPVDTFVYEPSTIRMLLGIKNNARAKLRTRELVKHVIGYVPVGPDHILDAFAVVAAHALCIGELKRRLPKNNPSIRVRSLAGSCL